jgi:cell division protein FtsB
MTRGRKLALVAVAGAGLLAALSAADARGLRRYVKLKAEIASYEEKRRALASENQGLRLEIQALSGDMRALERAAREDLGLVRPNEVVFTFEK